MKTFRKIFKLLPPAFAMRIWLKKRYGISVKPSPWGGIAAAVLAILPYAFTAALSVRVDSDSRLLKYFLPYGRISKFVRLMYGMQRGDAARDKGAARAVRAIMPYGLVLWWDAEDMRIAAGMMRKDNANVAELDLFDRRITDTERKEFRDRDRVEALALRALVMNCGVA